MSLLQNKKNVLAVFITTSILALSGCVWSDQTRPVETPTPVPTQAIQPVATTQSVATAQPLTMTPTAESVDSGVEARKLGLAPQSACIKQLDSLKPFLHLTINP